MSVFRLESLFRPSSLAVIGASQKHHSVGHIVLRNLLEAGFEGPVLPVNPKYESVAGVLAYARVEDLPIAPEMAVICTPPQTVPLLLDQLGARGTRAAIVLTAGLRTEGPPGATLTDAALEAAQRHGMRVLGPNCLGLLVPAIGMNASFAHRHARPGHLAFVSQSGGICTAVLDWAHRRDIGFSHFVSLGESADVDVADVIDYLGEQRDTQAILLYLESIRNARKFLSAARGVARSVPVIAVKAGRNPAGSRAAASHTGAITANDEVYESAFRRAGILRVAGTENLFEAAETLSHARPLLGDRLLIVSNGGGPAVMAVDRLVHRGGRLAELSETTLQELDAVLPGTWSGGNPIDLIGDATPERYARTLEIVARDPGVDALLVLHAPTAVLSSVEAAQAVARICGPLACPVLTCWLGGHRLEDARRALHDVGLPTYDSLEQAVDSFLGRVRYRQLHIDLRQTPPSLPEHFEPRTSEVRQIVRDVLASGRAQLDELEAKRVLDAYGIPIVDSRYAGNVDEAIAAAREIGFPVAVKICSREISHKSDIGGVMLDLESAEAVREAVKAIDERTKAIRPDLSFGFTVQKMAPHRHRHEVIVGVMRDPVFGPVIVFGHGGTAVEVLDDSAVALPPLNLHLAAELIDRTRVARLLHGYRDRPPADLEALRLTLVKISQLVIDLPELVELDINPLLVGEVGVLALDARLGVERFEASARDHEGPAHLAIRPYPQELEEEIELQGGERIVLRPIRPEDEPAHRRLFEGLSSESVYFRFFGFVRDMPHERLSRYTQIDYDREMAFIAVRDRDGQSETLGVVRLIFGADPQGAEFAIVIRSDEQGHGLGRQLLEKAIRYCRDRGTHQIVGQVLAENRRMLSLARDLGFTAQRVDGNVIEVTLDLDSGSEEHRTTDG